MSTNKELQTRRDAAVARGLGNILPVYVDRAENAEIWDVEGNRYIDFASGIAVLNTGHLHPKVKAAVKAQMDRFSHTCFMVTPYESGVALAEKLNAAAPVDGPAKSIFVTTGAEAVENAVKIARAYTGRSGVITFSGGFHGRTFMAMALTGKVAPYKASFGPMPPEVFHAPFPMPFHGVSVEDAIKGLKQLFKVDIEPGRVAAMIVEPVQGEGGFYPAPAEFLRALREICDEHGIVFIADEIQTGFARTGKMFAIEHSGVKPDLITMAKSLAGGFPIAAVTGKAQIMDAPHPGGLGGTYAGSPLGTSAALAVLEVIEEENLCQRSLELGAHMVGKLAALQREIACIGEIRHLGAMVAMELTKGTAGEPDAELTKELVQLAATRGLVLLSCGVYANVIRFLAPITASNEIIDEGIAILRDCLLELVSRDKVA